MIRFTPAPNCADCSAKSSCFVEEAGLSTGPDLFDKFQRRRRGRELSRGDVLFRDGERPQGVWIVCAGSIKVTRESASGKPLILRIAEPGSLLGYPAFVSNDPYGCEGVAMERAVVSFLDREYLEGVLSDGPEVAVPLLRRLAKLLGDAESIATNMAYQHARERVVETLYKLAAVELGESHSYDGVTVSLRRQDLAGLAGLSVETIVRVVKGLEVEGLVSVRGRQIRLNRHAEFDRVAYYHVAAGVA